MIKKVLPVLLAAAFVLSACQPGGKAAIPDGPPMEGCMVTSTIPQADPTVQALIPAVDENDNILGNKEAAVTFIEYSDYQCPYCAMIAPVLAQLHEKYPDDVRIVFRHFPIPSHPNALIMAYGAEAAGEQEKFYEMSDAIFAAQAEWMALTEADLETWLVAKAAELDLDATKYQADFADPIVRGRVDASLELAMTVGIPGTPFLFINHIPYQSDMSLGTLSSLVELFALADEQYQQCPPMIVDAARQYTVVMKTTKGEVKLNLYADQAPLAVNSFVFLARQGWFDDVPFHRVLPGFVAQGGDPSGSGMGGPGYQFDNENTDAVFDRAGLVAMANSGANTNGSQFFITYDAAPDLDGNYTIFGEVLEGMEVVESLTARDPASGAELPEADRIISVKITEK
ncbi:MAG: peptidylprolyl isomerase [Anaerolineaceae bacterium]|nr:peptidylprolyl isomerase [Anaerolineaceae bacterium]